MKMLFLLPFIISGLTMPAYAEPAHEEVESISIKAEGCLGNAKARSTSPFIYSVKSHHDYTKSVTKTTSKDGREVADTIIGNYKTGVFIAITPTKNTGEFDVVVNESKKIGQQSFNGVDSPDISNREYRGRVVFENDVWKKIDLNPDLFGENCSMEIKVIWID